MNNSEKYYRKIPSGWWQIRRSPEAGEAALSEQTMLEQRQPSMDIGNLKSCRWMRNL